MDVQVAHIKSRLLILILLFPHRRIVPSLARLWRQKKKSARHRNLGSHPKKTKKTTPAQVAGWQLQRWILKNRASRESRSSLMSVWSAGGKTRSLSRRGFNKGTSRRAGRDEEQAGRTLFHLLNLIMEMHISDCCAAFIFVPAHRCVCVCAELQFPASDVNLMSECLRINESYRRRKPFHVQWAPFGFFLHINTVHMLI